MDGKIELEDVRTVESKVDKNNPSNVVIGRTGEMRLIDPKTGMSQATAIIPYGSVLFVKDGQKLKKGEVICEWDPFNAVIISEDSGKVAFEDIEQGVTYRVEIDEQTDSSRKSSPSRGTRRRSQASSFRIPRRDPEDLQPACWSQHRGGGRREDRFRKGIGQDPEEECESGRYHRWDFPV